MSWNPFARRGKPSTKSGKVKNKLWGAQPRFEELEERVVPTNNPGVTGLGQTPLTFEPNQGQADSQVKFLRTARAMACSSRGTRRF